MVVPIFGTHSGPKNGFSVTVDGNGEQNQACSVLLSQVRSKAGVYASKYLYKKNNSMIIKFLSRLTP